MCLFCLFLPASPPLLPGCLWELGSFAYGAVCREYVSYVSFLCLNVNSCLCSCCVFCSPSSWVSKQLSALLLLQDVIFWGLFIFVFLHLLLCLPIANVSFLFVSSPLPFLPGCLLEYCWFAYGAVCRWYVSCVSSSCLKVYSCLCSCCVFSSPPSWVSKQLYLLLLCLQGVIFGAFLFLCVCLCSPGPVHC